MECVPCKPIKPDRRIGLTRRLEHDGSILVRGYRQLVFCPSVSVRGVFIEQRLGEGDSPALDLESVDDRFGAYPAILRADREHEIR